MDLSPYHRGRHGRHGRRRRSGTDPSRAGGALGRRGQPPGRRSLLRQPHLGGDARRATCRSAERRTDRGRQHAPGVLGRPRLVGVDRREVHRRRGGRRRHSGLDDLWNPAPRLWQLRRRRHGIGRGLPRVDRHHRIPSGRVEGGDHRRTRRPRDGRLPVGWPARRTLRLDPLRRRHADPQSRPPPCTSMADT